jgi:hypothetical protein
MPSWTSMRSWRMWSALILISWACVLLASASVLSYGKNQNTSEDQQETQNSPSRLTPSPPLRPTPRVPPNHKHPYQDMQKFLQTALSIVAEPKITDWFIVAITAVYARVAYLQWRAVREQANILAASNRPWAHVGEYTVYVQPMPDGRQRMRIHTQLSNTGGTPAFRVEYRTEIVFLEKSPNVEPFYIPPEGMDWMPKTGGESTIFPNQPTGGNIMDYPFTPDYWAQVMNEQRFIVYATWINYWDGEGRRHHTRTCLLYRPFMNGFQSCINGNDAS